MIYRVKIINNGQITEFDSISRNSLGHLKDHGGNICKVYDKKSGKQLGESRYSDKFGYYRVVFK